MKNPDPSAALNRHTWDGMDQFASSTSLEDGLHSIQLKSDEGRPTSLDLYVRLKPATSLTVHFYGAQAYRKPGDTPIFKGYRTSENLNTSYVLLHDPTLSLTTKIGLGWYEGFKGFVASRFIVRAVTHIAQVARAPRTILWGGSAGGYAALRNVGAIPNAIAFVWNPQTSIPRYRPSPVRTYAQTAFGTAHLAEVAAGSTGHVIDLTRQPSPNWNDAHVVYLQEADDSHVSRHLSYFLRSQFPETALEVTRRDTMHGLLSPKFYLHQSHWKPGHSAPPQPVIEQFLHALVNLDHPIPEIFKGLTAQSRFLLHHTREPDRAPLITELNSPVHQPEGAAPVLQWGSKFGQDIVAEASRSTPLIVKRNITGQSVIAAYTNRTKSAPKTSLITRRANNNEHWRMMLADRRASARAAINDDPTVQLVVIDFLEEVRGTVNTGNYFILTNHKLIRRVDRGPMVKHEFGDERHRRLWKSRISRLGSAIDKSTAQLVIVDVDASHLTPADWVWLGVPKPTPAAVDAWTSLMDDARELLPNATWIDIQTNGIPLSKQVGVSATHVTETIQRILSNGSTPDRKRESSASRPSAGVPTS